MYCDTEWSVWGKEEKDLLSSASFEEHNTSGKNWKTCFCGVTEKDAVMYCARGQAVVMRLMAGEECLLGDCVIG